jgi:hypothetical protein
MIADSGLEQDYVTLKFVRGTRLTTTSRTLRRRSEGL